MIACTTAEHYMFSAGQPITINGQPVSTAVSCHGGADGTLTVNATSNLGVPLSYSLDGGDFTLQNTFSGLSAGTYGIVVLDTLGNSVSVVGVVPQPDQLIIFSALSTPVSCNGFADGTISIIAQGGTGTISYSFNGAAGPFGTSNVKNGLAVGTYSIAIIDSNNCITTGLATVNGPNGLVIQQLVPTRVSCNGGSDGSLIVVQSGGTSPVNYTLTKGTTTIKQNSPLFQNLVAGSYAVSVTDASGCTATASTVIQEPTAILAQATGLPTSCSTSSDGAIIIAAQGGTPPLTFSIDGGATFQASNLFTRLAPTTYAIVVQDALGCRQFLQATVQQAAPLIITSISTTPVKNQGLHKGIIMINATGGTPPLVYSIDGGSTFFGSNTFMGLAIGTYAIVVKDTNGCQVTAIAEVEGPCPSGTCSRKSYCARI